MLQRVPGDMDAEPDEERFRVASAVASGAPAKGVERCSVDLDGAEPSIEHLRNGVAVGTFELPPIPLARLPETSLGLPSKPTRGDGALSRDSRRELPDRSPPKA